MPPMNYKPPYPQTGETWKDWTEEAFEVVCIAYSCEDGVDVVVYKAGRQHYTRHLATWFDAMRRMDR